MADPMITPITDSMAKAGPGDPYREPSPLFDFIDGLEKAFSTISAQEFAVAFITTVLASLVLAVIGWLVTKAWGGLSRVFWRAIARLGVLPGLEGFVVRGYLSRVRARFGTVRNIYLDREEELDLNRVFVPLTLRARFDRSGEQDVDPGIATPQTTREILTQNPRLVILGAPGSGKTTLLKALASGVSQHQWPEWRDLVPIFVSLRAFSRVPDKPELYDWLAHTLLPGEYGIRHAGPLLKKLLAKDRLLLLLDGLDEVNAGDLPSVLNRIHAFLKEYACPQQSSAASPQQKSPSHCHVLLTCREQNYDLLSDNTLLRTRGMVEYRFTDMRDSEVVAMVQSRRQDFEARPNRAIPNFLAAIRANPRVFQLHRNPLLLTLSIGLYLHRLDDAVPQHRTEFYDESIRHLLRRHDFLTDPGLGKGNRFDYRDKYALLCRFALESMEAALARGVDFEDFRVADLIEVADGLAQKLLSIKPNEGRELVTEIQVHAGLIADTSNREIYTFAHRSFHEYCAARELVNLGDEGFQRLQEHLTQPAWRQTLLFYCGMDHRHAEQVVEQLLETSDHATNPGELALAGHCAAVLVRPHIELRLRVVFGLGAALSAKDAEGHQPLLLALLELGRDVPLEVRATVEEQLRASILREDPAELAANLGRLGKAALPLLHFLAHSQNPDHQRTVLGPVMELEGPEKIDLLWQLLTAFHARGDTERAAAVRRQLLLEMQAEGAVKRLDSLPVHFPELTEAELRAVYPFPAPDNAPGNDNFARLLKLEADAIGQQQLSVFPYLQGSTDSWQRFLELALGPKTPRKTWEWQNLPADRQRRVWSIPWQWLGRIGVGIVVLAGFLTIWLNNPNLQGHKQDINSVAFSPDGQIILTGADDGTARLWDIKTGREINRPSAYLSDIISVVFSSDGQTFLTGSDDNTARLWDTNTGQKIRSFSGHSSDVNSVVFSPDGQKILTGSDDDTARLWNINTGQEIYRFDHWLDVKSVAFSPDGRTILTGSGEGTTQWDANTGDEIHRFVKDLYEISGFTDDAVHLMGDVKSVAFSPDGQKILTGSNDGTTRLRDANNGEMIRHFSWHWDDVNSVAFSPDGQKILTGSDNNIARLWNTNTGQKNRDFEHPSNVNSVAFSSDGMRILTGSDDDRARLWDVGTGKLLWVSPVPFWNPYAWNRYDILVFALLVFLLGFLPTTKLFDPGRRLYFRKPNPYLHLYDIPGVERWLPKEEEGKK
uniref:WD40 repeat n=1 Tax=Candidatus Kentrum sp. FW TaxID=2126338 RepID=A0A450TJ95_9GAMM|nr:MAG: WD40 repeat [Candidatus Kentron sp. FW]